MSASEMCVGQSLVVGEECDVLRPGSPRFVRGCHSFSDICAQMSRNLRFLQKHRREPSDLHD